MEHYLIHPYSIKDIEEILNNNTEESINLDFKRGDALKNVEENKKEIAKDVSAFANSDGGLIIYGIAEKNYKADSYAFVDGNQITKEWLEQIINSRIHRKIDELTIDPIRIDNTIEQTIYVVKIPRSLNAPHQTSHKKFYKRYNFESVEMEEYEIRNLYTRQDKTSLKIARPRIFGSPSMSQGEKIIKFRVSMEFNIENTGKMIEKVYKMEIKIPRLVAASSDPHGLQDFFKNLLRHEETYSFFSIPNSSPLFQNEYTTIGKVEIYITKDNFASIVDNEIQLKLYYSNGIDEYHFNLSKLLQYKDRQLSLDCFQ
jgi:hypothetical protein